MPNYFGPAFQIEVNDRELQADVSKNVEQVSVVSMPDMMDTFSITLSNEYPIMRWTHTPDADLFMEGNTVKISMGYVDDLGEVIDGEITKVNPTFPDSGAPTVVVEGQTRMHRLHGGKQTRAFQSLSDKQIIEKIAGDANLSPQVQDTGEDFDYIMQPNQSDLQFIKARAARIHYEVLVQGRVLIFRKAQEMAAKSFTFVWGHTQEAFSGGPDTLPLKSFSPDMSAMQQVHKVTVRGWDPANKQAIVGTAGKGDEDATDMGNSTGADILQSRFNLQREHVRVNLPVASQAEADAMAKAIYNERAMQLVGGSGSTIGVPGMKSGIVVELRGLGPRFSGMYYVKQATHTIGSGGYSTDFTVQRNAISNGS
jgi:uncharacterized protein